MRRSMLVLVGFVLLALLASGCALVTWGSNLSGELGSSTSLVTGPTEVGGSWATAALGDEHTCGIQTNQTLWCWGRNYDYELGLGGRGSPRAPTQHPGTWLSVAEGWSHTCAVRSDGQLWCAGTNGRGQLGAGWFATEGEGQELLTRSGTDSDWRQVAADTYSTCGIKADTTLWCWGAGVGDGTPTDRSSPVHVGTGPGWTAVSVGNTVTCGIRNGQLWCWKSMNATTTPSSVPVRVGTESDWVVIGARQSHACGIRSGGLWCWGTNQSGQLGDGSTTAAVTPIRIGADTDWLDVAPGTDHTCGVKVGGTLWCWGRNHKGQLGFGDTTDRRVPTQVGTATDWQRVESGAKHTCALATDTKLSCWGDDVEGQLGLGLRHASPGPVIGGGVWQQVSAGGDYRGGHTCAISYGRSLWCWGENGSGQLGLGAGADRPSPAQVGTATDWLEVSTGSAHTCAVKTSGSLWCWGDNDDAQTGGGPGPTSTPRQVGTGSTWKYVTAGTQHTCAVTTTGRLLCFGAGYLLGTDGATTTAVPKLVGGGTDWTTVEAGLNHTCAIRENRSLWCWGVDNFGQVGAGGAALGYAPAPLHIAPGTTWVDVSGGERHSCGVRTGGSLWCWGSNQVGELGLGTLGAARTVPTEVVGFSDWTDVDVGSGFGCGVRRDRTLRCWGANDAGQLGDGTLAPRFSPTLVATADKVGSVSVGHSHSAAVVVRSGA